MLEPEEIVAHVVRLLRQVTSCWNGLRVVVTAGPTREPIDPVRMITNPSTGRMGYALASAAFTRGSDVRLISGPSLLEPPTGVETTIVETTADMLAAVSAAVKTADVLIMAAAPADYVVKKPSHEKRPRTNGPWDITLEPTPDILHSIADVKPPNCTVVGFALEVGDGAVDRAREKLRAKALDMIVMNRADEVGAGFETETNRVTLISEKSEQRIEMMPKWAVAEEILDAVEALL